MTDQEQRAAAKEFAKKWQGRGDEKSDTQEFWSTLLRDVYGVEKPEAMIEFERRVQLGHKSFVDAYIGPTKVLIEQKKLGIDLATPAKQSDGQLLTPYKQAKRYADNMSYDDKPRWIVTCNFETFNIHDMKRPHDAPEEILLKDLEKEYFRLQFLVDDQSELLRKETEVSIKAGDLVGILYDLLLAQYDDPKDPEALRSLNVLCVRLVFCLYAEDAGIFGKRNMFHDFMAKYDDDDDFRDALIKLFQILDKRPEERDAYGNEKLNAFPYVNGGIFSEQRIIVPRLTKQIRAAILSKASEGFDWSAISPTIFGAIFESTLNSETRRSGGMHYTSIDNIHKVIDPLFLDDLRAELDGIEKIKDLVTKRQRATEFQKKLASLKFLDPACGSGNFLTETYLSLRKLENEAIEMIYDGMSFFVEEGVQVSIGQFYGIEINDYAVSVAKTALWIAESQMLAATRKIIQRDLDFLPLKTNATIVEGNALTLNWNEVCPKEELSYIVGNPPFVGRRYRSESQQREISMFFDYKDIDYVACWYAKAAEMMQGTSIHTAFVATNSISQGEQVAALWQPLVKKYGVEIDFAYKTFRWDSEANLKAHVHCVIIGFSCGHDDYVKKIFTQDQNVVLPNHINGYLLDAPDVFIGIRSQPICDVPLMKNGNVPLDGDALKIEESEYPLFSDFPHVKRLMGGRELLHNEKRYVLWLVGVAPDVINRFPEVKKRVALCRERRLAMKDPSTRKLADYPTTFRDTNNPANFIALPMVSSEKRKYLPLAYLNGDVIATNQIQTIPNATLYHFGVLTSIVHMAWTRAVCGRLKSDYRYSKDIVYNNFVWPDATDEQKKAIEETAQGVLDARAKYPDSSLAALYDETVMPSELRKAHEANDRAVLKAYGFSPKASEEEIVAALMKLYSAATADRRA